MFLFDDKLIILLIRLFNIPTINFTKFWSFFTHFFKQIL